MALRSRLRSGGLARLASRVPIRFRSSDALCAWHFWLFSSPGHLNRAGLALALRCLAHQPARILETGTSAWGTDSTRLWSAYVRRFGGELWSVDLRPDAAERLGYLGPRVHLVTGDSVEFISDLARSNADPFVLVYLDSWDVDWQDPLPAARHGLREWHALQPLLTGGSVIVVDDTPATIARVPDQGVAEAFRFQEEFGVLPGKGALILRDIRDRPDLEVLHHDYNLVLRVR